jgi:hypothetical protein
MPPSSTNPTNTTTLISNLNPEETADLLLKFEAYRKNLACPKCAKRGVFRRNSSTKSEPPQPIFRSNGCGASFRAATMRSIAYSSFSTSTQLSLMEISRTSTEPPNTHTEDMQILLNMVKRLTNELAAARSEIEQLRATTIQLQSQLNKAYTSSSQLEPLLATASQSSLNSSGLNTTSTPWRNPERLQYMKEELFQRQQHKRQQCQKLPQDFCNHPRQTRVSSIFTSPRRPEYLSDSSNPPLAQTRYQ